MRSLRLTTEAAENLDDIAEFVAEQSGSRLIAERLFERLLGRCEKLSRLPGTLGTARPELGNGLRSAPQSGYVIFFRYLDGALEVVNILHGSRDVIAHFGESDDT